MDWFKNVDPMNKITEGLYLCNCKAATDVQLLKETGITHILRVAREDVGPMFQNEFIYKLLEMRDIPEQNIIAHFEEAHAFINSALKKNSNGEVKGKVLVHCHAGVSRSSTIVISYLMRKYINFSLNDALKFVKSKRPIIKPNKGFMKQLQKYEDKLKKDYLESDLKTPFTKRIRKDQIVD